MFAVSEDRTRDQHRNNNASICLCRCEFFLITIEYNISFLNDRK